ncbi:MAG: DUF3794 domain-containing protein [Clostridia bacterium]|nr:DUF3794 domain-containing protein [Clostridia bacterium]
METDKEFLKERYIPAVISESSGEYTLPDYNTDVKRLLSINARAVPSSSFMDGETLECVGVVAYDIIYLDSENNLTHCEFTTDYELRVKCNSESYQDARVGTRVKNYSVRPLGPRRFSAKCVLDSAIYITERERIAIEGDAFTDGEPEVSTAMAQAATAYYSERQEREYAETLISLEGVIADDVDVLALSSSIRLNNIAPVEGGVEYQGELEATALLVIGDELPTHRSVIIPISGMLPIEDMEEGMDAAVDVCVTSLRSSINPTEVGVDITVSAITEATATARGNESVRLITDCYLKECGIENQYTNVDFCAHLGTKRENIGLEMEFDRKDVGAESLRNIIHSFAVCSLDESAVDADGVTLKGNLRLSVMACEINDDGMPAYVGLKIDVPFSEKVKHSCQNATNAICEMQVISCDLSLDGEKLYICATIGCSTVLLGNSTHRIVTSSVKAEECTAPLGSDIVIYYPEEGESLFEVARLFRTSLLKLASDNSLSESAFRSPSSSSSLSGVRKLIIK